MKVLRGISFFAVLIFLWNSVSAQEKDHYKLTVKIKNAKDKTFFLGYPYGDKKYLMDTADVNAAGEIIFEGDSKLEGGLYFIYAPNNVYFEFIGSPNEFSIETDTLDFVGNMNVTGSKENELFKSFDQFMKNKQLEVKNIQQKLKLSGDDAEKEKWTQRLSEVDAEVRQFREQLVEENKGTFTSALVKATIDVPIPDELQDADPKDRYHYVKAHYFDNIDFSDRRLLYTPILHRKINDYVDKLTSPMPDSLLASSIHILELAKANDDVFRYALVTLSNKYETSKVMGQDAVFVGLAERYYLTGQATWADSALVEKIRTKVRELHPLIGEQAPEMVLSDTTLTKKYSLYNSNNADYTILYFYADDCGHCKKKTPVWHDTYVNELKKRNVELLAVDINVDVDAWKDFVKKFELTWVNLADPNKQDNFRYLYTIDRTPKVFVVDKEKKVIAKDLDAEQIVDFIDRQIEFKAQEQQSN